MSIVTITSGSDDKGKSHEIIPESSKESETDNLIYVPKDENVSLEVTSNRKSNASNNKSNDSMRSTTPLNPFYAEFISKVKFR